MGDTSLLVAISRARGDSKKLLEIIEEVRREQHEKTMRYVQLKQAAPCARIDLSYEGVKMQDDEDLVERAERIAMLYRWGILALLLGFWAFVIFMLYLWFK